MRPSKQASTQTEKKDNKFYFTSFLISLHKPPDDNKIQEKFKKKKKALKRRRKKTVENIITKKLKWLNDFYTISLIV